MPIQLVVISLCLLIGIWFFQASASAAPIAGTQIGNQASATYIDDSQTTRTVTSNTVFTTVQQVASLSLSVNGAKRVTPGGQVSYPHTLINTGNGTDSFSLSSSNSGSFGFSSVQFFADVDGDGKPDNTSPITSSGELSTGAAFSFVAVGNVPGTAVSDNTNTLTVTATSDFTPTLSASNTDVSTVTSNAVINVTLAIDINSGISPSGPRTYTLTYTNTGNSPATAVNLINALPGGLTYVANSARWSVTGNTVLTDAGNADSQSGIVYDFNVTAPNRVTAVIDSVGAGVSGTLTFQVNINSALAPGANSLTSNIASYHYHDGVNPVTTSNTNSVQFIVAQSAAVTLAGASVANAPQGGTVSFVNELVNTGNGTDSFDIEVSADTFPSGTSFSIYQSDGVTPMVDSNGNGTPDTGPLAAGVSYSVVVKVMLPSGASAGPYTLQVSATSSFDSNQSATATNTLTAITANIVDITNNAIGVGAPGIGAGPEGSAVVTNTVDPGSTSRFTLYVTNSSTVADGFNLQFSTDSSFATESLPTGWSVVFKNNSGTLISNTGVIAAGNSELVYADVTVPSGYAAGNVDIYFRVASPSSGANDRIHNAVSINTLRAIKLTPNNNGQLYAGGSVVYSHTLRNYGNVTEGNELPSTVALTLVNSQSGFSSVVYWDRNNDGTLDASDPTLTNLSALTGGSNGASTSAGLNPGESVTLFVKVYAPASATVGMVNTVTLTATTTGVINGVNAPAATISTSTSTVVAGQVNLIKSQALDADCDGTPEAAYATGLITSGAIPGACVRYQITATNAGSASVSSVVVSDATPANTTYHSTNPATTTIGTINAPSNGSIGTVQATVGTLTPGQVVVIVFGVRIDP